ncbi:N-acetylmuramoyl-L-alanine amidase family protein [Clostridium weizhouense]|uniref:N-acetylmuramoyl-L-alanine amidase family protein n=1 Tax=Clostridium weizhouense TaxID=2859781 RepID=A0ABS7ANN7_9CLOT|nr:N-acetylmuramoyl-L-alanine amidase family protein [Clostridium weizhouense]MBW6410249.1 N-acetylmuramoyl-L-alanine amidase family protein [Clostridium weizhouense]
MIKRANKITSLLLVAAAVTSLVPATGVNAASYKRIESKDGTIYSAQAYKDGKFIIDGNVKDEDTEAVYFLNNGKYSELKDIDTGSEFTGIFAEKNLQFDDDDYSVDLSTGKVYDDGLRDENKDDAATSLRKKIKNKADDRYSDHDTLKNNLEELKGSKYGETWYKTTYKADYITNGATDKDSELTVYTDVKGNYIDADYNLGKVRVRADGKSVNIENTDDKYNVGDNKKALSAKVSDADVIAQDSNNIYRTATITINVDNSLVTDGTAANLTINDIKEAVNAVEGVNVEGSVKKAIKDQVDNEASLEGATVETVKTTAAAVTVVTPEANKLTDGKTTLQEIKDALTAGATGIVKAVQDAIVNAAQNAYDAETDVAQKDAKAIAAANAAKAQIIADATEIQNAANNAKGIGTSKVTLEEINGVKIDEHSDVFKKSADGSSVSFEVIQKISKAQASKDIDGAKYAKTVNNYVISDKDADREELLGGEFTAVNGKLIEYKVDGENINAQTISLKSRSGHYYTDISKDSDQDLENETSFDIDVDGNLWALNGGFVYKWDNDEDWDKVYKVDGSMEKISVYDKDNMVVWNEDDEVYSVIDGKSDSGSETDPDIKTGWDQDVNGNWIFFDTAGNQIKNNWVNSNGKYYYMDYNGIMQSNKWVCPYGNWYYLNADGSMAHSGWLNDRGNWYYLNGNGNMLTGWQYVNGTWYFMQESGAMKTGWLNDRGNWYYLNSNGSMKTGWLNDNGAWYYLEGSGRMLSNTTVDGYRLGANGAWIR